IHRPGERLAPHRFAAGGRRGQGTWEGPVGDDRATPGRVERDAARTRRWRAYLTAEDLEREKVLESFGVQMIRLNKFNLGKDPVATIDALLRERLDGM